MAQRYFLEDPNEINLRLEEEFKQELIEKLPINNRDRYARDIVKRYFGTFDLRCLVWGCGDHTIRAYEPESDY